MIAYSKALKPAFLSVLIVFMFLPAFSLAEGPSDDRTAGRIDSQDVIGNTPSADSPSAIETEVLPEPQPETSEAAPADIPSAEKSEEAPDSISAAPSKPADLKKLEGRGLWARAADGALGKDLWKNTPRSFLNGAIQQLPAEARDSAVQRLMMGALLSETDPSVLNDIEPQAGEDLLTLRMEKLIEAGAYRQAFEIYASLEGDVYSERLAGSGILAMLYAGEKSLACLEVNTAREQFPQAELLNTISTWCNASLSEAPDTNAQEALKTQGYAMLAQIIADPSFRMAYDTAAYANMKPLERAVFSADKRMDVPEFDSAAANKLPARDIQVLLVKEDLSPQNRFLLLSAAIDRGLAKPEELQRLYVSAMEPAAGKDFVAPDLAVLQDWQKLAYYYYASTVESSDENRWAILRQALPYGRIYGYASLSPFAALLTELEPSDPSFDEIVATFKVMNKAGLKIPSSWREKALTQPSDVSDNQQYYHLITAAYVSGPKSGRTTAKTQEILEKTQALEVNHRHLIISVIENIDKGSAPVDNAYKIYENKKNLTFSQDYVMPSLFVWDYLLKAAQDGNKGQVVLLSVAALHGAPLQETYPGVLADTLQGLSEVGLTDVSVDLATTAVLGNID